MAQAPNDRKKWMSLLAKAPSALLDELFGELSRIPSFTWLRAPEVGAVMVRGRAGAVGAPFNLGEMTVTRCALRLATGEVGHSYVQGRDKEKARQAAVIDALMQTEESDLVSRTVLGPIEQALNTRRQERAAKADATRVDFFTLMRGED
ncbi:MAG: phosphonate C-P lyase system protein PhnG [Pseudomonadota bacterium]